MCVVAFGIGCIGVLADMARAVVLHVHVRQVAYPARVRAQPGQPHGRVWR